MGAVELVKQKRNLDGAAAKAIQLVQKEGLSDDLARATERLTRLPLDEVSRTLLSDADIYGELLRHAIEVDKVKITAPADITGLVESIRQNVDSPKFRGLFEGAVVQEVFRVNQIRLGKADQSEEEARLSKALSQRILGRVRAATLPLAPGEPSALILGIHREIAADGDLPTLVRDWGTSTGIPAAAVDRAGRPAHGLPPAGARDPVPAGRSPRAGSVFRERRTHQAARSQASSSDPVVLTSAQAVTVTPWDFQVDTFDAAEEQGVLRENILAAGALDYVWNFGDVLGVFKLADALVLRWAAGMVDIDDAALSSKLYRYWQLRDRSAVPPEERGMLYKRVLARATPSCSRGWSSTGLRRAAVAQPDGTSVADYIRDSERRRALGGRVSRIPIYRATESLPVQPHAST